MAVVNDAARSTWAACVTGAKRLLAAVAFIVAIGFVFPPALSLLTLPFVFVGALLGSSNSEPTPEQMAAMQARRAAFEEAHASSIALCRRVGVSEQMLQLTMAFAPHDDHAAAELQLMRLAAKRLYAEALDEQVRRLPKDFTEPSVPFYVWNPQDTEKMRGAGLTDEEIDEMWREARSYTRPEFGDLDREQRIAFIAGQI